MAVDTRAALAKLTGGQTLTNEERAALGLGAAPAPAPTPTPTPTPQATAETVAPSAPLTVTSLRNPAITAQVGTRLYDTIVAQNAAAQSNQLKKDAGPPTAPQGYYYSWVNNDWKLYKSPTPSTPPVSGAGGGATTQTNQQVTDLQNQVKALQAKIDTQAAQKIAEQQASKQKASDKLTALFSSYGLSNLASFISEQIMSDVSEDMVMLKIYDRPEYKQKFPGMEKLRAKGRTITEAEYMGIEKAMVQTARFFDLPAGFYDSSADFGTLIGNEVSAKEYQDRLQVGQDLARNLNPAIKNALLDMYGIGEGGITAYVLDSEKALSLIQKQARASQFVGFARDAGFKLADMTAAGAEAIAGTESYAKLSAQQLQQQLGQAGQLRRTQERLSGIEGATYNEQEALNAVVGGSPEALLASQQRAARETARFTGRSGISSTSLRSTDLV